MKKKKFVCFSECSARGIDFSVKVFPLGCFHVLAVGPDEFRSGAGSVNEFSKTCVWFAGCLKMRLFSLRGLLLSTILLITFFFHLSKLHALELFVRKKFCSIIQ